MLIVSISPQIQRQQPVYLVDTLNRECPFHLEFVQSPNPLLSVLKDNLKDSGCGPGMIDRGEFVIEDAGTRAAVDLTQNWNTCFFPGQMVAMRMVFRQVAPPAACPGCRTIHAASTEGQVTCTVCGIIFRRMDPFSDWPEGRYHFRKLLNRATSQNMSVYSPEVARMSDPRESERDFTVTTSADVAKFRLLRIITTLPHNFLAYLLILNPERWRKIEPYLEIQKRMEASIVGINSYKITRRVS